MYSTSMLFSDKGNGATGENQMDLRYVNLRPGGGGGHFAPPCDLSTITRKRTGAA